MKLTNGEIFGAREPLQKLMEEKLPVKVAYGLAKIAHKVDEQLKVIEQVRQGLIKTYGKEEKGQIKVDPESENFQKFVEEFNELMEQEVEMVFTKVTLPETLEIEPQALMALEKFVDVK